MKRLLVTGTILGLALATTALAQNDDGQGNRKERREAAAQRHNAPHSAPAAQASAAPQARPTNAQQTERQAMLRAQAARSNRPTTVAPGVAAGFNNQNNVHNGEIPRPRPTTDQNLKHRNYSDVLRNYHRERHDRRWYREHYRTIVLFGGGYYYQNAGYWYPAWGYDPYYTNYVYDQPIYAYNGLPPDQVISTVQRELQRYGYYQSAVDGLMGPNTRAALANYQRDRGLPMTSAIDEPTMASLGLA
jgi:hypothetical protein